MRSLARAKPSASLPLGSHRAAVLTPALGSLPEVNVGERGIASVLAEQRFLLGRGPQHDAVGPLHNYATIVTTLPDYRRAHNVTNDSGLQRTVTNHKPKRLGARGKQ